MDSASLDRDINENEPNNAMSFAEHFQELKYR